jgi:hypothetical protein
MSNLGARTASGMSVGTALSRAGRCRGTAARREKLRKDECTPSERRDMPGDVSINACPCSVLFHWNGLKIKSFRATHAAAETNT